MAWEIKCYFNTRLRHRHQTRNTGNYATRPLAKDAAEAFAAAGSVTFDAGTANVRVVPIHAIDWMDLEQI